MKALILYCHPERSPLLHKINFRNVIDGFFLKIFPQFPSLQAGIVAWISAPILLQQIWVLLLRFHIIPSLRAVGLSGRLVSHREATQDGSFFYIQSGLLRASVQVLLTNPPLAMTGSGVSFHKEANLYSPTICHPRNSN